MEQIDERRLETDAEYRFAYVARSIGFGPPDVRAIRDVAPELERHLPPLLDAIYVRFHEFDATWRHFLSRQRGCPFSGVPLCRRLETLDVDDGVIRFRKHSLGLYFRRLLVRPYDRTMVAHLDSMGRLHHAPDNPSRLNVPLVQMNAFMGMVSDLFTDTIHALDLPRDRERTTTRAFHKVLWLQSDLITRHYQDPSLVPGDSR